MQHVSQATLAIGKRKQARPYALYVHEMPEHRHKTTIMPETMVAHKSFDAVLPPAILHLSGIKGCHRSPHRIRRQGRFEGTLFNGIQNTQQYLRYFMGF